MKFLCFLLLGLSFLTAGLPARAQQSVAFKKDRPVQLLAYSRLYDANNTSMSKGRLKRSGRFTKDEVQEIFRRLGQNELLPPALNQRRYDNIDLARYKCYEQSSFSLLGYHFSLVWLPADENAHMPPDMRPPNAEGVAFYTGSENLSTRGRDAAGRPLPPAGSLVGTPVPGGATRPAGSSSGSIQVSSADMSAFVNNATHGSMILYYGTGSTPSAAYIYELRGRELSDKQSVAAELSRRVTGTPFIGFEHRLGNCAAAEGYVRGKAGSSISTHCAGEYRLPNPSAPAPARAAQPSSVTCSGNCQDGQGTARFSSGNVYTGAFRNGRFHGHGRMSFASGNVLDGEFVDHVPQRGTFTYAADGTVFTGSFNADGTPASGTYRSRQTGGLVQVQGGSITSVSNPRLDSLRAAQPKVLTKACPQCKGVGFTTGTSTSTEQLTPNVYQASSTGVASLVSPGQVLKTTHTVQHKCSGCGGTGQVSTR